MSDVICVTDRACCAEPLAARVEKLAAARPRAILLRAKELREDEYRALAREVRAVCRRYGTPCILHGFPEAARALGAPALHLPLPLLRALSPAERERFAALGTSCHSLADVAEAEALGCAYLVAGHIFDTACKAGTPGRGLDFLRAVTARTALPVFAIGGITPERAPAVRAAGARGVCVMSGAMRCADPARYLAAFGEAGTGTAGTF